MSFRVRAGDVHFSAEAILVQEIQQFSSAEFVAPIIFHKYHL